MSIYVVRKSDLAGLLASPLASVLALALILWATGLPMLLRSADAAQLTNVSDTISDSEYGVAAKHTIEFTATNAIYANQTIKISLDPSGTSPGTSAFTEAFSTATGTDITVDAGGAYSIVSSCTAGNQMTAVGNYNGGVDENLTLTMCAGASTIATSTVVTITVGAAGTNLWTNPNPGTPTSYVIRIAGSMTNSGDTRIATISNVTVTASIDTTFTFTIAGTTTARSINGTTTSIDTSGSATTIPFGTLVPGTPVKAGQDLTVATNAKNGFVVTVQEDSPLTSSTGAYIPLFSNGASTTAPIVWTVPTGTLDQPWTYSHWGVTSSDSNLSTDTGSGNDDFTGTKFAGNLVTPRAVFAHTGPSDGLSGNKGFSSVLYEIQITALQAAGNDYTNQLIYVATPTF